MRVGGAICEVVNCIVFAYSFLVGIIVEKPCSTVMRYETPHTYASWNVFNSWDSILADITAHLIGLICRRRCFTMMRGHSALVPT